MSLFVQVLASGSKGNATLICSAKTRILIDAGLSAKQLVYRLEATGIEPRQLSAVVISHEHQDHVRGAGVMSRRFDLPVYLTRGTLENLPYQIGHLQPQIFTPGAPFKIGDLEIQPFSISHDAREPAGFVIEHNGCRLGVCTDLGIATHLVRTRLQACHGLVLEANHDIEMLQKGPYPPHLQQRIRSRHGHLSNADTCELLKEIHHIRLQAVIFAHLSEVNNHPDVVKLSSQGLRCQPEWESVRFEIGKQYEVTPGIELF
jgi:phosphoribosyl 1,2-cyclic phosphodiesterase